MFARRDRHLRIPLPEELTEAVLIHAGCQRKPPSVGLRKLGGRAVLSRISYRFLNPPHKVGGLRAPSRLARSVCHAGVVGREIAVSFLASARGLKRA